MSARTFRHEHIREQLVREIGWAIHNKVRDPRVPMIVTVADMKLSPDTRNATVYVNVYGTDAEKKGAVIALNHAAPYIQRLVGQRVKLRHFPKLLFKIDDSIDRGMRIDELLREVKDDLV